MLKVLLSRNYYYADGLRYDIMRLQEYTTGLLTSYFLLLTSIGIWTLFERTGERVESVELRGSWGVESLWGKIPAYYSFIASALN